jgi:hypothetical protein
MALLILAGGAHPLVAGLREEPLPTDHWAYERIYELYASDVWGRWPIGTRPWYRGDISDRVRDIRKRHTGKPFLTSEEEGILLRLESEFYDDLRSEYRDGDFETRVGGEASGLAGFERYDQALYRGRIQGFAGTGTGPWWARLRVDIDSHGELDRTFFGEVWKDQLTGTVDLAFVSLRHKGFELEVGRDFIRWGSAPHDVLLLGDQSPPFDMARVAFHHKIFDFSFFITGLDSNFSHPDDASPPPAPLVKRYFSGHRLEIRPHRRLEVGLSEVVVYGGAGRQLEGYYLNPLLPYYWEQLNVDTDDNPLWALDASYLVPGGPMLYGEFLIDDFQIDFKSEPQQVGWLLGFNWHRLLGIRGSFVTFDWTHLEPTVYRGTKPHNRYLNWGVGMGSTLGPDAERYYLRWRQHVSQTVDVTFYGKLIRSGETTIRTPLESPVTRNEFPTGVVEATTETRLNVNYQPSAHLRVNVGGGYRWRENVGHVSDSDQNGPFFEASIALTGWHTGSF